LGKVLIELHDVCKSFGDKVLFDNFNLTIDAGEFVVITGESGCGKTTLLNMIGGLEPVSNGKINVDGSDITNTKNLKKYYRNTVGFVFSKFCFGGTENSRRKFANGSFERKIWDNGRRSIGICWYGSLTETKGLFSIWW